MAAIAAVRFPLHRDGSVGAAAAPTGGFGASCGTLSCTDERGRSGTGAVRCGIGMVCGGPFGGMENPGGGDTGGWTVTLTASAWRL
jgi:hypothetical protein